MSAAVIAGGAPRGPSFTIGNRQPFGTADATATGSYNIFWLAGSAFSATKNGGIDHVTFALDGAASVAFMEIRDYSPGLYEVAAVSSPISASAGLQTVEVSLAFSTGEYLGMWVSGSSGVSVVGTITGSPDASLSVMAPAIVFYNDVPSSDDFTSAPPAPSAPGLTTTLDVNDTFTDTFPHIYGYRT